MTACPFFDPMKFLTDDKGSLSPEQQREIEAAFSRSMQQPIAQVLEEGIQRGELRQHQLTPGVLLFSQCDDALAVSRASKYQAGPADAAAGVSR